jgi:translation initiation factor IF-2
MAAASKGLVVAFHTDFDSAYVKKTAEREGVEVRNYKIIYKLLEDIAQILTGLLEPEIVRVVLGRAELRQVFLTKKKEIIIGCKVLSGKLQNKAKHIVGTGIIDSLRKVDEIVKEIGEGNECGIKFIGDVALEEGDLLEAFAEEEKRRTIT